MAEWGARVDVQLVADDESAGNSEAFDFRVLPGRLPRGTRGGRKMAFATCSGSCSTPLARSDAARPSAQSTRSRPHARSGGRPTPDRLRFRRPVAGCSPTDHDHRRSRPSTSRMRLGRHRRLRGRRCHRFGAGASSLRDGVRPSLRRGRTVAALGTGLPAASALLANWLLCASWRGPVRVLGKRSLLRLPLAGGGCTLRSHSLSPSNGCRRDSRDRVRPTTSRSGSSGRPRGCRAPKPRHSARASPGTSVDRSRLSTSACAPTGASKGSVALRVNAPETASATSWRSLSRSLTTKPTCPESGSLVSHLRRGARKSAAVRVGGRPSPPSMPVISTSMPAIPRGSSGELMMRTGASLGPPVPSPASWTLRMDPSSSLMPKAEQACSATTNKRCPPTAPHFLAGGCRSETDDIRCAVMEDGRGSFRPSQQVLLASLNGYKPVPACPDLT